MNIRLLKRKIKRNLRIWIPRRGIDPCFILVKNIPFIGLRRRVMAGREVVEGLG
jgi:hypothetical protein